MADGQITRRDIIEDEALKWGPEYGKQMEVAIGKNKEFANSILLVNQAMSDLRKTTSQKDFNVVLERTNELSKQSVNVWREQDQAEKALITTMRKHELATEATNRALLKERTLLAETNKQVKQEVLERLGLVSAYTKLSKARTEAKDKLKDLMVAENASRADIKKAQREFDVLDRKIRKADAAVGDFSRNVGNYPFKNLTANIKGLIGAFGLTTGLAAAASIIRDVIKITKEFDQSIADLQAITGATGKDLAYLRTQAILMGRDTKGGAVAVSEAFKLIAGAKPELLENVEALNQVTESVLLLAKASGMEMPAAATALTDAMNQFGADASQATTFVDALANGAKYGSAEIPQITEALLKFGAVARSSNVSIGESTALVELLAENGLKGADAGTALRNVLLKLSATDALPKKAVEELKSLGINMELLGDKTIPIQTKLEALKPLLKDNASIVKIFGLENATAAINVLEHTDRLAELTGKMSENGTAAQQAAIRTNTLEGAWDRLMSTYDSFILSLDGGDNIFSNAMKRTVGMVTVLVETGRRLITSNEQLQEEERSAIRKKGIADAVKAYSDRAKYDDEYLEKLRESNTKEVLANQEQIRRIQAQNAEVQTNAKKYGFNRAKILTANLAKIEAINKKSRELNAKTAGINSVLSSRNPSAGPDPAATAEGEAIKGLTDKQIAEAKRAAKERYEIAKKLQDDIFKLSQFRLQVAIAVEDEITANEKLSYDERLEALLSSQQIQEAKTREAAERELQLLGKYNDDKGVFVRELTDVEIKAVLDGKKKKETLTSEQVLLFEKYQNDLSLLAKKGEDDREKLVAGQVAAFKKVMDAQIKEQDTALNDQLAAENTAYQNRLDAIKKFYEQKKGLGQLSAKEQAAQNSEIEAATFTHEQSVFEIKKKASTDALNMQIKQIEDILNAEKTREDGSKLSTEAIAEYENQLSKYRLELTDIGSQKYEEASNRRIELEQQTNERIKELGANLAEALIGLTNAIFDARIANIESDIEKNNEYYDAEIEKAGDNERKKEKLEEERDKKNAKLEKERRKEAYKAAVFNKVMSAAQIAMDLARTLVAINLAAAQMDALAAFGFGAVGASYRGLQIGLAIGVAAAQTATILATPLPKLKDGRKDGPATFAIVGDGGRSEIISNPDGSNPRRTPATSTLTYLKEHEMVHKSDTDYNRFMRASIITNVQVQNQKMNDYQSGKQFDKNYDKEMLEELKLTRKALEKTKRPVVLQGQKIDIPHSIWSSNNIHWS